MQTCMEQIMLTGGRNSCKTAYLNKTKLRPEGGLGEKYLCFKEAYNKAKLYFNLFLSIIVFSKKLI